MAPKRQQESGAERRKNKKQRESACASLAGMLKTSVLSGNVAYAVCCMHAAGR